MLFSKQSFKHITPVSYIILLLYYAHKRKKIFFFKNSFVRKPSIYRTRGMVYGNHGMFQGCLIFDTHQYENVQWHRCSTHTRRYRFETVFILFFFQIIKTPRSTPDERPGGEESKASGSERKPEHMCAPYATPRPLPGPSAATSVPPTPAPLPTRRRVLINNSTAAVTGQRPSRAARVM